MKGGASTSPSPNDSRLAAMAMLTRKAIFQRNVLINGWVIAATSGFRRQPIHPATGWTRPRRGPLELEQKFSPLSLGRCC